MHASLWVLFAVNLLALLYFGTIGWIGPIMSNLDATLRFTELDRLGAINTGALRRFHVPLNTEDLSYRSVVARYLVEDAISNQRMTAWWAVTLSVANLVLFASMAKLATRKKRDFCQEAWDDANRSGVVSIDDSGP